MQLMPKISYAQNFEDIILDRFFQLAEPGFYIDIGAGWETNDSVTKMFYMKGWKGINIEPDPKMIRSYIETRPSDINLECMIADENRVYDFYLFEGSGLSTANKSYFSEHRRKGLDGKKLKIQGYRMDYIWAHFVPKNQDVHFMKIDAEGFESQIINGNNWTKNRPWVLAIESVLPYSLERIEAEWEAVLTKHKYQFCYYDGLNSFYIALEHRDSLSLSLDPPNFIKDHFVKYRELQSNQRADAAEQQIELANQRAEAAEQQIGLANQRAEAAKHQIELANQRAEAAKHQIGLANQRAEAAKHQIGLANQRAEAAKHQIGMANQRAEAAEQQIGLANQRAEAAEQQIGLANQRAEAAEQQIGLANQRAEAAEQQIGLANQRAEAAEQQFNESQTCKINQPGQETDCK